MLRETEFANSLRRSKVNERGYVLWCRETPVTPEMINGIGRGLAEDFFTRGKDRNDHSCWGWRRSVTTSKGSGRGVAVREVLVHYSTTDV